MLSSARSIPRFVRGVPLLRGVRIPAAFRRLTSVPTFARPSMGIAWRSTSTVADVNPGSTSTAATSAQSSPPVAQLYKSSHKGSGTVPIPRRAAAGSSSRGRSTPAPEAAILFGARSNCAEDQGPVAQRQLSALQKRQLLFKNKAAFVLSPQAQRRVKYLLSQFAINHPPPTGEKGGYELPVGIRIGVRRRGCSGYSYTVNYAFPSQLEKMQGQGTEANGSSPQRRFGSGLLDDVVVEQDGVKVIVDADALFYVIGTEMDYVVRNVEEKFTFKNPNQKYSCGCEESFMPFDEDDLDD